jgi:hypothetical protein
MDGNVAYRLLESERGFDGANLVIYGGVLESFDGGYVGPAAFAVHDG